MRAACFLLLFTTSSFAGVDGMQTRVFSLKNEWVGGYTFVHPDQMAQASPMGFQEPLPLFAANDPDAGGSPVLPRQTAKAVLLNEGVSFPPGASASFHPQSGLLSVHNTPENLRLTQLFMESLEDDLPINLSYLVTVIEAPGEVIRQVNAAAASTPDCDKELSALLTAARQPNSEVRVVGDAFIESKSSHRSTFCSVQEHLIPRGLTTKAKSAVTIDMDLVESGLKFETETWHDEKDLRLTLEVNNLPPSLRSLTISDPAKGQSGSFPATSIWQSKLTTAHNCQSGRTRLISVSRPLGAKGTDVLWAVFLNATTKRISSTPAPFASTIESQQVAHASSGLKQIMFDLPEGFLDFFVPEHTPKYLQRWLESNGLEKARGASASLTNGKLTATNTQENIERIHGILREMRRSLPGTAICTLNTIQASAARLRDLTRAHVTHGDHEALWRALQEALAKGDATYIDTAQITADANFRATHHSGHENSFITNFSTNENGQASVDFESRTTGSLIELESWLPAQEDYVLIHLMHELQTGPTSSIRHAFKNSSSGQLFELSLPDLHTAKTTHSFCMTPGTTRLISLCRPTGNVKSDVLWATFISCDVVRQIPSKQDAPLVSAPTATQPLKLETRTFRPPVKFFASAANGWGPITDASAAMALKEFGITMPSNAEIHVSNDPSVIHVTSTREYLELIDARFKKADERLSQSVVVTAHVFEGSGPFIREVAQGVCRKMDHSNLLTSLQTDAKIGKVKYLTTMRVEAKNGVKTQTEQVRLIQQMTGIRPSDNNGTEFVMDMHKSGDLFSLEPKIRPVGDAITLELELESSSTDPVERQEQLIDAQGKRLDFPLLDFPGSKLTTSIEMTPGTSRLVWIYRPPEATDDRLQALFLNYNLNP